MSDGYVSEVLWGLNKDQKTYKLWYVSAIDGVVSAKYCKEHGKITMKCSPKSKPKNIGKSNETTPKQQAVLEAKAMYAKKLKSDYAPSKELLQPSTLPPLAKKYQDQKKDVFKKRKLGSVKLNGVRCTLFYKGGKVRFQSRGGEDYPVIEEIAKEAITTVFGDDPDATIDGELYCHGMFLEDIVACVKKHNEDTKKINFHVFDVVSSVGLKDKLEDRYLGYMDWFNLLGCTRMSVIKQTYIYNEVEMIRWHDEVVAEGYEGLVLRDPESLFVFGIRTSEFLKYKIALDIECQVVRVVEDKNGCGVPWCKILVKKGTPLNRKGEVYQEDTLVEFAAPYKGTHQRRKQILDNEKVYVGKWLNLEFEAYSKYGKPLKPIGQHFRKCNDVGDPLE